MKPGDVLELCSIIYPTRISLAILADQDTPLSRQKKEKAIQSRCTWTLTLPLQRLNRVPGINETRRLASRKLRPARLRR